jgi:phosphoglycolate phosphatase-like HAD superfamily hydrolase
MLTLIFDIDGTLTDMWPIERCVLAQIIQKTCIDQINTLKNRGINDLYTLYCMVTHSRPGKLTFRSRYREAFIQLNANNMLPKPVAYQAVKFISNNQQIYRYVYATGGLKIEAEYILFSFGIDTLFDLKQSISRDTYKYSKLTGLPFRKLNMMLKPSLIIADSKSDRMGATIAKVPVLLLKPNKTLTPSMIEQAMLTQIQPND